MQPKSNPFTGHRAENKEDRDDATESQPISRSATADADLSGRDPGHEAHVPRFDRGSDSQGSGNPETRSVRLPCGQRRLRGYCQANLDAFKRWRLVPRFLRDVGQRDLSVELFGKRLPAPFLLAPVGFSRFCTTRPSWRWQGRPDRLAWA